MDKRLNNASDFSNNKIARIGEILKLLSKRNELSTPNLAQMFEVSKKIIQTDMSEYILPLFSNTNEIYYSYSTKCYHAKSNFLSKTLLSAEELAIIAILKAKSKDKYSDFELSYKVDALFDKLNNELSNKLYQKSSVEKIDNFKEEIIQIKNAIEAKQVISCFYNNKQRDEIYPLKILNLEGYWYLIIFDVNEQKLKTFHLNTIKDIKLLDKHYDYDEETIKSFDNAITAYYKPGNKRIIIELFIDATVSRYFLRKPLNHTQRVIKKYDDGSLELEIIVTDLMEIISTVQRYMPHIGVIAPNELKVKVKSHLETYIERFD